MMVFLSLRLHSNFTTLYWGPGGKLLAVLLSFIGGVKNYQEIVNWVLNVMLTLENNLYDCVTFRGTDNTSSVFPPDQGIVGIPHCIQRKPLEKGPI